MTDIYDIKDVFLWLPINVLYSLIYILFIIVLHFIYKNILSKYVNKENNEKEEVIIEREIDFNKMISDFKEKNINSDKEIFYSWLIKILKEILKNNYKKDISKMTFEEISILNIDNNLKELIKNIYFKEYKKTIEDNRESREEYIEKVKSLIK